MNKYKDDIEVFRRLNNYYDTTDMNKKEYIDTWFQLMNPTLVFAERIEIFKKISEFDFY